MTRVFHPAFDLSCDPFRLTAILSVNNVSNSIPRNEKLSISSIINSLKRHSGGLGALCSTCFHPRTVSFNHQAAQDHIDGRGKTEPLFRSFSLCFGIETINRNIRDDDRGKNHDDRAASALILDPLDTFSVRGNVVGRKRREGRRDGSIDRQIYAARGRGKKRKEKKKKNGGEKSRRILGSDEEKTREEVVLTW